MLQKKERRAEERFVSNAAVISTNFSTKNWSENRSVALNLSEGGMCFESKHAFKLHAYLYIRTGQNPGTDSGKDNWDLLHISTFAEVRWCREIARKDGTWYRFGVKYI